MENVFNLPTNDLINIREELESYRNETKFGGSHSLPTNEEDIMKLLDIDDPNVFKQLQESVDLDTMLSDPGDVRVLPFSTSNLHSQMRQPIVEVSKDVMQLNTFREVVAFKKKFYGNVFGPSIYTYHYPEEPPVSQTPDLVPYDDFLISIRVYRPYHSTHIGPIAKPRFNEEFIVRGNQYLTELRDKISCDSKCPLLDISENPFPVYRPLDSDPGFFFITDTFYNDTRNPLNSDYSEVILKWAETRKTGTFTCKFKSALMQETKFQDLNVRLGFPQVYQHFGNCEHLFTFSWIELLSPAGNLASKEYPILKSIELSNKQRCSVCGQRDCTFIVRNSDRHMHDPVHLCRICLNSYHYDDGKKIGEFSAYRLYDEMNEEVVVVSSEDEDL